MLADVQIEQLHTTVEHMEELSELLIQVVEDGASIGFLPPIELSEAMDYWEEVINPDVLLFVAKKNNRIIGSIQLHLSSKQNGLHRAEIAKLIIEEMGLVVCSWRRLKKSQL